MNSNQVLNQNDPQCEMFNIKAVSEEQSAARSSPSSVSEDSSEDKLPTEEKRPMKSNLIQGGILNPVEGNTSSNDETSEGSGPVSPRRSSSRSNEEVNGDRRYSGSAEPSAISGKVSYAKSDPEEEKRSNAIISHYEPGQNLADTNNAFPHPEEKVTIPPISSLGSVKPNLTPMEPRSAPPFNGYTYSRIPVYSIMQLPHPSTMSTPFTPGINEWPTATDNSLFAQNQIYPTHNTQTQQAMPSINSYPYNVTSPLPGTSVPNGYPQVAPNMGNTAPPTPSTPGVPQSTEYYDQQGYQSAVHDLQQPGMHPMINPMYSYSNGAGIADSGYDAQYAMDPMQNMYRKEFMNPNSKVYHNNNNVNNPQTNPEGTRRRGNLPKEVTRLLKNWLLDNIDNPYPTEDDKMRLVEQTGLSLVQISNWFINARRRSIPANQRKRKLNHNDRK